MAQLDRFLAVLVSNRADRLRLNESTPAALDIQGVPRPITRQPLTGQQVLMLLREIAPADAVRQLDAGAPASFRYSSPDGEFTVQAAPEAGKWHASVSLEEPRMSGGFRTVSLTPAAVAGQQESAAGNGGASVNGQTTVAADPVASAAGAQVSGGPAASDRINALLRQMVERGASDLHLRCGEPPIFRTHGEMMRVDNAGPLEGEELERMLTAIMPGRNISEFTELNDTDFAHELSGFARFRANVLRDRNGPAAVFRHIPATVVTVEQMAITQEVQNLCYLTKGLVLVTGPTGSGKSTTLCALMDLVNRTRTDHVITIEDPIEFVHPNKRCIITQRQVGVHTTSFKHALRAALREDPDIILVGELRDLETVSIAIETAETGHLVFGTLHTTTAASTIDRVIDQFPPDRQEQIRVMLSESLKGVISQTLCKKIGGGRVAAREILLSIPAVSNLIREAKTFQIPSVMQTSRRLGMVTLGDALIDLVEAGKVEPKEAYMKSTDKLTFLNLLRTRGHDTSFLDGDLAASAESAGRVDPGQKPGPGAAPKGAPPVRPAARR